MRQTTRSAANKVAGWARKRFGLEQKEAPQEAHCNICKAKYRRTSKYTRFCSFCRSQSELYHISEWMPVSGSILILKSS